MRHYIIRIEVNRYFEMTYRFLGIASPCVQNDTEKVVSQRQSRMVTDRAATAGNCTVRSPFLANAKTIFT